MKGLACLALNGTGFTKIHYCTKNLLRIHYILQFYISLDPRLKSKTSIGPQKWKIICLFNDNVIWLISFLK